MSINSPLRNVEAFQQWLPWVKARIVPPKRPIDPLVAKYGAIREYNPPAFMKDRMAKEAAYKAAKSDPNHAYNTKNRHKPSGKKPFMKHYRKPFQKKGISP